MRKTIENETENSFGTDVLPNIKERNDRRIHSLSTSATSSDIITFDTESLMNLELSSQSTSSTYSGASTPSCINNNWFDLDMEAAMACPLIEINSVSRHEVCNSDTGELREFKKSYGMEVLNQGTTLMASILFPTVIVKMERKKMHNSMLYYIVLEPLSGHCVEQIVCLMFSSRNDRGNIMWTGELLPLLVTRSESCTGGVSLVPMLLYKRYRSVFEKGCKFRVKDIEQGRRLNQNARKWKDYDIEKSQIPQLLRRLLYLDISQMPIDILNRFLPSTNAKEVTQSLVPANPEFPLMHRMTDEPQIRCSPILRQNAIPRRRTGRRRSSFAKFLNTATQTRTSKEFVGYLKPRQRLENIKNNPKLSIYVSLSSMI